MLLYFLLGLIIIFLLINKTSFEMFDNRSQLSPYYKANFKKDKDVCGNCDGVCQDKETGTGYGNPQSCNRIKFSQNKNIFRDKAFIDKPYYSNETPKTTDITGLGIYNCNDIRELLNAQYVLISSDAYGKTLGFETFATNSAIFIEKQFKINCANFKAQKWQIVMKTPLRKDKCLINIVSYSNDANRQPNYYLYSDSDGKLGVSLYGGSNNQLWELENYGENSYLIKSHLHCTYLTCRDDGGLKRDSGVVMMTDIKEPNDCGEICKGCVWNFLLCGEQEKPRERREIRREREKEPEPVNQETRDFSCGDFSVALPPPNQEDEAGEEGVDDGVLNRIDTTIGTTETDNSVTLELMSNNKIYNDLDMLKVKKKNYLPWRSPNDSPNVEGSEKLPYGKSVWMKNFEKQWIGNYYFKMFIPKDLTNPQEVNVDMMVQIDVDNSDTYTQQKGTAQLFFIEDGKRKEITQKLPIKSYGSNIMYSNEIDKSVVMDGKDSLIYKLADNVGDDNVVLYLERKAGDNLIVKYIIGDDYKIYDAVRR